MSMIFRTIGLLIGLRTPTLWSGPALLVKTENAAKFPNNVEEPSATTRDYYLISKLVSGQTCWEWRDHAEEQWPSDSRESCARKNKNKKLNRMKSHLLLLNLLLINYFSMTSFNYFYCFLCYFCLFVWLSPSISFNNLMKP
jgi:hypothetical protein